MDKYNYSPLENPHFKVDNNYYVIDRKFKILVNNYNKCLKTNNCSNEEKMQMGKFLGKIYFRHSQ